MPNSRALAIGPAKDGQHMLVSVGSGSNVDDPDTHPKEFHRANILEYTPEGKFVEVYSYGIRNPAGRGQSEDRQSGAPRMSATNSATIWCRTT